MSEQSSSQFIHLPVLVKAQDYSTWALAIQGQAMIENLWSIYSTRTRPTPLPVTHPDANELKENKAKIKEWDLANEKVIGLIWRTISQDLQMVLGKYWHVITAATPTTAAVTQVPTVANLWTYLQGRFEKSDGISAIIDWGNLINTKLTDDGSSSMEDQLTTHATH